eukprot:scaffold1052_cov198-Alexandrium_tamarense.AAC.18
MGDSRINTFVVHSRRMEWLCSFAIRVDVGCQVVPRTGVSCTAISDSSYRSATPTLLSGGRAGAESQDGRTDL